MSNIFYRYHKTPSIHKFMAKDLKDIEGEKTFTVEVTPKIHGTNSSIVYNISEKTFYCQSRNRVISVNSDNHGFASFCEERKDDIHEIVSRMVEGCPSLKDKTIILWGEFVGGGTSVKTALVELPKHFVVFDVAIVFGKEEYCHEFKTELLELMVKPHYPERILPMVHFTERFKVDLSSDVEVNKFIDKMQQRVEAVNSQCPVAWRLSNETVSGKGEGIVCKLYPTHFRFKMIAEDFKKKVSMSGDKGKLQKFSEEQLKASGFIEEHLTENRMQQALDYMKEQGEVSEKSIGEYFQWLNNDLFTEEGWRLESMENGKDIAKWVKKFIPTQSKQYFFDNLYK